MASDTSKMNVTETENQPKPGDQNPNNNNNITNSENPADQPILTNSAGILRAKYITCDRPCVTATELNLKESDVPVNWEKLQIINPIRLMYKLAELLNEDMPVINLQNNFISFRDVTITLYLNDNPLVKRLQVDRKKLLCDLYLKNLYPKKHRLLDDFKKFDNKKLYNVSRDQAAYNISRNKRLAKIQEEISKRKEEIEKNENYSDFFKASKIEKLAAKLIMPESVEYDYLAEQEKLNWITVLNHTCMVNDLKSYYDTYRGFRDGSRELINNRLKQKKKETFLKETETNTNANAETKTETTTDQGTVSKNKEEQENEEIKDQEPSTTPRTITPESTPLPLQKTHIENERDPITFIKTIVQIKLAFKPDDSETEQTLFILEHSKAIENIEENSSAKKISEIRQKLVSETRSEAAKYAIIKLVQDNIITADKVVSELMSKKCKFDTLGTFKKTTIKEKINSKVEMKRKRGEFQGQNNKETKKGVFEDGIYYEDNEDDGNGYDYRTSWGKKNGQHQDMYQGQDYYDQGNYYW